MRLSDIEVVSAGNHCELRAQVTCDPTVAAHPNVSEWFAGGKPCELWYRFPKEMQQKAIRERLATAERSHALSGT
ncbi:MAG: hypothetical protein ABFE08_02200 [Armatimonadia bacterium]